MRAERNRLRLERDITGIRERCKTLAGFVKEAWHILEPDTPLIWNWHMEAICQHLEAITWGEINRLLINVPPGSSKSLIVSVFWQAWEWTYPQFRSYRYLTTAYNEDPVKRDSRKCRDLLQSEWYRRLYPDVVLIRAGEMSFANANTGNREGVPFRSLTSQRGDRLIIDDPHSVQTAESDADRKAVTRNFREGALNRLNDQKRSAIVVVMQRLHEDDLSGVITKLRLGYVHLMLPMEFDPARACHTEIGFSDPREKDGELLDAKRVPDEEIRKLKKGMTTYAYAGQYQQRPVPREGGLFKREWFAGKIVKHPPEGTTWVRHWDLAATKKETAAFTAGVRLGKTPDGKFVVGHVIRTQDEGNAVRKLIKATAEVDGERVKISLPQDPGQAGKVQAQDYVTMLAGYTVTANVESGDKETRAEPFSAQCEAGNVVLVAGDWNERYLDELCLFPGSTFKDQVDASSGAFGQLVGKNKPKYGMLEVIG